MCGSSQGGMCGSSQRGACTVAPGGGACVVALGAMHGCLGACVVA